LAFQLDRASAHMLGQRHISMTDYAVLIGVVREVVTMIWYGIAALIIWRKPGDRGALMTAFFLILAPVAGESQWTVLNLGGVALALVVAFVLLFPDGRFVPPWTGWLASLGGVFFISLNAIPGPSGQSSAWVSVLGTTVPAGLLVGTVGVQVYRYRRISTWTERRQTKWVLFGLAVAILGFVSLWPLQNGNGSLSNNLANITGTEIVLSAIPISIAIAMLRSRLWDVDRVISRALAFAMLSAVLAGIYLGSVIGLQAIFRAITGRQSYLAIAISTLVIAALFNPLHHRVQDVIARTFYRKRYDAAKVLAAFGATCRDETDLERLRDDMVRVVEETVQPARVSLWLRETPRAG
jgi:hypothetical protein